MFHQPIPLSVEQSLVSPYFPLEVPSPCEAPSSPGPIAVTGAQVIQGTAQGADLETVPAKAE